MGVSSQKATLEFNNGDKTEIQNAGNKS